MYIKTLNNYLQQLIALGSEPSQKRRKTESPEENVQTQKMKIITDQILPFIQQETFSSPLSTPKLLRRAQKLEAVIQAIDHNHLCIEVVKAIQTQQEQIYEELVTRLATTSSFEDRKKLVDEAQVKTSVDWRALFAKTKGKIHILPIKLADTFYYVDINLLKQTASVIVPPFYQEAETWLTTAKSPYLDLSEHHFDKESWEDTLSYLEKTRDSLDFFALNEKGKAWSEKQATSMMLCSHFLGYNQGVYYAGLSLTIPLRGIKKAFTEHAFSWLTPEIFEIMSVYELPKTKTRILLYFIEYFKYLNNGRSEIAALAKTEISTANQPLNLALSLLQHNKHSLFIKFEFLNIVPVLSLLPQFFLNDNCQWRLNFVWEYEKTPNNINAQKLHDLLAHFTACYPHFKLYLSIRLDSKEGEENIFMLQGNFYHFHHIDIIADFESTEDYLPSMLVVPPGRNSRLESFNFSYYYSNDETIHPATFSCLQAHPRLRVLKLSNIANDFKDVLSIALPFIEQACVVSENPDFTPHRLVTLFPHAKKIKIGFARSVSFYTLSRLFSLPHLEELTLINTKRLINDTVPIKDIGFIQFPVTCISPRLQKLTIFCNQRLAEDRFAHKSSKYVSKMTLLTSDSLFEQVRELADARPSLKINLKDLESLSPEEFRAAYPRLAIDNWELVAAICKAVPHKFQDEFNKVSWNLEFHEGKIRAYLNAKQMEDIKEKLEELNLDHLITALPHAGYHVDGKR